MSGVVAAEEPPQYLDVVPETMITCTNEEFNGRLFEPLAPQLSDYWHGTWPQILDGPGVLSIPMPPLPGASNLFTEADDLAGSVGTGISLDPRFWWGAPVLESSDPVCYSDDEWVFFCHEWPPQVGTYQSWYNQFQYAVGGDHLVDAPTEWPVSHQEAGIFSDWVDLYAPYLSRTFFTEYGGNEGGTASDNFGRFGFPRVGSPHHVDLPVNYPPVSLDVWGSTSVLVPSGAPRSNGFYGERETVEDRLDLITGEPLLREVDLELPFGSAVFRRVRTYAEHADAGVKGDNWRQTSGPIEAWRRGWHGQGWMSSDAPLFYFDAAQRGTVSRPGDSPIGPVCYFAPDAHHSIPFLRQDRGPEAPDYIAPEWFDAMLLYDKSTVEWGDISGEGEPVRYGWITPPAEMKVYLHDRSVVYTIKLYYEDVAPRDHEAPRVMTDGIDGGFGVPYYGLTTSIRDKSGNRVEITYADSDLHKPFWDPSVEARADGAARAGDPVMPVKQKGWYKGMIDHVKLYPAGESEAAWSLFYTYRTFFADRDHTRELFYSPEVDTTDLEWFVTYFDYNSHAPAVHSIMVYERDVPQSEIGADRKLILDCDTVVRGPEGDASGSDPGFVEILVHRAGYGENGDEPGRINRVFGRAVRPAVGGNQFDHQDEVVGPTGEGAAETITRLPNDWVHMAQFSYAEPSAYGDFTEIQRDGGVVVGDGEFDPREDYALASCGPVQIYGSYNGGTDQTSFLLKTAVWSRIEDGAGSLHSAPPRYWLYRYQDVEGPGPDLPVEYLGSGPGFWSNGTATDHYTRRLSHRFGPDTVARIYQNRPAESDACGINPFVNGLMGVDEDRSIEGALCYLEPPEPPSGPGPWTLGDLVGGSDDLYDDWGQVGGPEPQSRGQSATHSLDAADSDDLPVGLLADTIFYRWSQPYRLDERLFQDSAGQSIGAEGQPIARPSSWAVTDGLSAQSAFMTGLRERFVGGEISPACESVLDGYGEQYYLQDDEDEPQWEVRITQVDDPNTGFLPSGIGLYSTVGADGATKWYRMYRFISTPPEAEWKGSAYSRSGAGDPNRQFRGPEVVWDPMSRDFDGQEYHGSEEDIPNMVHATHAMYYYPYHFAAYPWDNQNDYGTPTTLKPADPMWWVVVDEYDSIEEAMEANSSLQHPDDTYANFNYGLVGADDGGAWNNRRVVGMNSTGLMLSDRTWINDGDAASTDDPPAVMRAWAYDPYSRPVFSFSRGWGAAAALGLGTETQEGLVERFVYDDPYEVNMGSPGHGADDLIVNIAPRAPLERYIRKGCDGGEVQVSAVEFYGIADAPQGAYEDEWTARQPKSETFFGLEEGTVEGVVEYFHGFWDASELPDPDENDGQEPEATQPPKRWDVRVGPEHQRWPGSPQFREMEGQWYNNKGQLVWRVAGAVASADVASIPADGRLTQLTTGAEVFLDYFQYDEDGRVTLTVEDIAVGTANAFGAGDLVFPGMPARPDGNGGTVSGPFHWEGMTEAPSGTLLVGDHVPADDVTATELGAMLTRISADHSSLLGSALGRRSEAPALNLVTFRAYNRFGEFKTVRPDGTRSLVAYEIDEEEVNELRELRAMDVSFHPGDGSWRFGGQGLFDSLLEGGRFSSGVQATIDELSQGDWDGSPNSLAAVFELPGLEVIAVLEPSYDTAGRLTGMTIADETEAPEPLSSAVSYNAWGDALLEITPDRRITRNRYDRLGRLHKVYTGSKDRHYRWRTSTGSDGDDLILTEKYYYGSSPTDAGLPNARWSYRERSDNQYEDSEWWEASDQDAPGSLEFTAGSGGPDEMSSGRLERYEYDWRMRRAITKYADFNDDFAEGDDAVYREERTFLDNLDRVRFVAVYGGPAGAAAPNPDIAPGSDLPLPSAFLGAGPGDNLLSLEETVYNSAGQVVERRRYDTEGTGGYLTTASFTDHANRALWNSSGGGMISRNTYDAKGRLFQSINLAGDTELSMSEQQYGSDGNVEAVYTIERLGDLNASTVNDLASVARRVNAVYTWYDSSSRVIATADLGWVDVAGGLDFMTQIPSRPDTSPEVVERIDTVFAGAAGESRRVLVGVDYPDSFFDASGRGIARLSAYWYDRLGKQNAVLMVTDASKDIGSGGVSLAFTIDRKEYNRYGQLVLEHRYGYSGTDDPSTLTDADFEFLGGTEYTFDAPFAFEGQSTPTIVSTTRVQTITPITDGGLIEWDDVKGRLHAEWLENDPSKRTTILEYNAPIVQADFEIPDFVLNGVSFQIPLDANDWGYLGISNRPDLLKAVHLPDPGTGVTGDGWGYSMFFFYYADGLPAARVDSRGIGVRYTYDADGNMTRISADDSNMPLVSEPGMADEGLPSNAIEYVYDALSRLETVRTGRDYLDGTFRTDTESLIAYDGLGNMLSEQQDRESVAGVLLSGTVSYAWDTHLRTDVGVPDQTFADYDGTNNVNRLLSITYPDRTATYNGSSHTPRVVHMGYGAPGSVSDLLGRVEELTSTGGPNGGALGHVATYRYDGRSRLAGVDSGDVPATTGLVHAQTDDRVFDRFGRVTQRTVDGYDTVTQTHQSILDSEFGYNLRGDRLYERLTQQQVATSLDRDDTHSGAFGYDLQGRLISEEYGTLKTNPFDGIDDAASDTFLMAMTYGLDTLNRRVGNGPAPGIETETWIDTDLDGIVDTPEVLSISHELDQRGGLIGLNDGTTTATVTQDVSGAVTDLAGTKVSYDWLGRPVLVRDASNRPIFAVSYDGFGRVATRSALWPSGGKSTIYRNEAYFYDGVRRIQEVFIDPIDATPPWPTGPFDQPLNSGSNTPRTEAEFVWSAASGQPFDTCHVQIDWWDREAWYLQDHQTATSRGFTSAHGELVQQHRFDAFGTLQGEDTFFLGTPGELYEGFRARIGHQGLFGERIDGDTLDDTHESGAEVWYQARSRWFVPELGRFLTSDPNATGVPTVGTLAMLGKMPAGPPSGSFDWWSHYGDGWDTWTAYGANPIGNQDPTGLTTLASNLGAIGGMAGLQGLSGGAGVSAAGGLLSATFGSAGATFTWGSGLLSLGLTGAYFNQAALSELVGDPLFDWLFGSTAMAYGASPTPDQIAGAITNQQYERFGDPNGWKFKGEKPGSNVPDNFGGFKKMDIWEWAKQKFVEVHYHIDQAGNIAEQTIKLSPYTP